MSQIAKTTQLVLAGLALRSHPHSPSQSTRGTTGCPAWATRGTVVPLMKLEHRGDPKSGWEKMSSESSAGGPPAGGLERRRRFGGGGANRSEQYLEISNNHTSRLLLPVTLTVGADSACSKWQDVRSNAPSWVRAPALGTSPVSLLCPFPKPCPLWARRV